MKRFFGLLIGALIALAPASAQSPQVRAVLMGVGGPAAGGGGFTGPGDIQSTGVFAWWGLRAYSAAKRGTAVANVCNSTGGVDVGCADMLSDAVTGALVSKTISGITCPGANCTVKILYDQSGANSCTISSVPAQPCNLGSISTVSSRPTLTTATLTFNGTSQFMRCAETVTCTGTGPSAPWVMSAVIERTGAFTTGSTYFGDGSGELAGYSNSAGTLASQCGSTGTVGSVTDSAYHAVQSQCNGASGIIYVDGSSNTRNMGSNGISITASGIWLGDDGFGGFFTGNVEEAGLWAGDQSAHFSALNSNQHTFWGF